MIERLQRLPTTPGEILSEEFLEPLGMTQKELADHIGCDVKVINRIVNGRSSVTAAMALKLASAPGHEPGALAEGAEGRRSLPGRGGGRRASAADPEGELTA